MRSMVRGIAIAVVAFPVGYWIAHRQAKRKAAFWYVQPAPPEMRREPREPNPDAPVVLDASFGRTNQPGSTTDMDL